MAILSGGWQSVEFSLVGYALYVVCTTRNKVDKPKQNAEKSDTFIL